MKQSTGSIVDFPVSRCKKPRAEVLEDLFSEHHEVLGAFVGQRARVLGVDAQDVIQEVFVRLADNKALIDKICSGEVNSRPYLLSMANNLLVDLARKRTTRKKYEERIRREVVDEMAMVDVSAEAAAIAHHELAVLKDVIMNLKPTWRQAFLLNRFGNLTYREISRHMGVSDKQVENFMARALVRIRRAQKALDG